MDLLPHEVEMAEVAIDAYQVAGLNRHQRRALRAYQEKLVEDVRDQIRRGYRRILVVLPTGGGKTVVFAEIIRRAIIKEATALVLAHRRELVMQTSAKLTDAEVEHGILMAGERYQPLFGVQVASVQTLHARGIKSERIVLPDARIVVVDEAHHLVANSWTAILDKYRDAIVLGFTATPARGDGRGLGGVFETMVVGPSVQELIDLGFLVGTRVYAPASIDVKGVKTVAGDYVASQLEERVNKAKVIGDIVGNYLQHGGGEKAIAFFPGVASSMHCAAELKKAGIKAAHIDGTTPKAERDAILEQLRTAAIQVVCNCMVLTEGFDAPDVGCIIIARPTKNLALYLQMVGRGLRPASHKKHCIVIDHADCTRRHGFAEDPTEWSIDPDKKAGRNQKAPRDGDHRSRIKECPSCGSLMTAGQPCPACGFKPAHQPKALLTEDGELGLLDRKSKKARAAEWSVEQKLSFYGELRWIAADRGYADGWAWHKYRARFDKGPPSGPKPDPVYPRPETPSWVRSQQIRWAKGQARRAAA
jgi:superfamily II DNA or RNA helicase